VNIASRPFLTHCRHARRSGTDDLITITITITITVGGIITIIIIITARTAITITTMPGSIITTTRDYDD
jgi:hypothetical protein